MFQYKKGAVKIEESQSSWPYVSTSPSMPDARWSFTMNPANYLPVSVYRQTAWPSWEKGRIHAV